MEPSQGLLLIREEKARQPCLVSYPDQVDASWQTKPNNDNNWVG